MQLLPEKSFRCIQDVVKKERDDHCSVVLTKNPSLRALFSKQPSERPRRKVISTHAVQSIQLSMGYSSNCVPWYRKKRVVFQINELRKRLEYLLHDSHYLSTGGILPSSVPTQLRGTFQQSCAHNNGGKEERIIEEKKGFRMRRHDLTRFPFTSRRHGRLSLNESEKENKDVIDTINKKRENVFRVLTGSRMHREKATNKLLQSRSQAWLSTSSSSSSKSGSWYLRPNANSKEVLREPVYCSMEMISFDKENECFHRTEIAYPSQPLARVPLAKNGIMDEGNEGGTAATSGRRLAKKLEIRTAAINNIYKHFLIWE